MNDFTIRKKLYLVFGLLIAIFIVNGVYTGYSLKSINNGALRIATQHLRAVLTGVESSRTLADYRQCEFSIVTATTLPNRIHATQEERKRADQLDITFDAIEPTVPAEVREEFAQLRTEWNRYKAVSQEAIGLANNGNQAEALQLLEKSSSDYADMVVKLDRTVAARKDFIQSEINAATSRYDITRVILLASILLVVLLSLILASYLSKNIMNSINYLKKVSEEVSNGNLTIKAVPQARDELGDLILAYANTIQHLRELIKRIQDTAGEVAELASQLNANADQSAQATQQVAASITNVAGNTSQQGNTVQKSLGYIQTMAVNLHGFEDKASISATSAREVSDVAASGSSDIRGAVDQMATIAVSVMTSAKVIQKLAERSSEIGEISATISGIADQTNLLSLNAAIEAARAGEHGYGFAVVAQEVRKLAQESNAAAQKIATLINSIQEDTTNAVDQMQKGTVNVENGREVIAKAGAAFATITDAVDDLNMHAYTILNEAKSSAVMAEDLVKIMEAINETGHKVARETESVSAATEEQSASMYEVAQASQKLAVLAQNLTNATCQFKL